MTQPLNVITQPLDVIKQPLSTLLDELPRNSRDLYQVFTPDEEVERITYHYEVNPAFFERVTGGEWNTYSCNWWEPGFSLTQAQEAKLDKFAQKMQLKPGMRILDVGCGWGGPLVYLCHRYGVVGHGITLSPAAIPVAVARAKKYGVSATFEVLHWRDLRDLNGFDAIYTDEVIVHFNDLSGFFKKSCQLLKPGGVLVNKELHFVHSKHAHALDSLSQHINKVYGYSGNYRTLQEELTLLDVNGLPLVDIESIPIEHYKVTIAQHWLKHVNQHQAELAAYTGAKHVRDFKLYLKGICHIFSLGVFGLHIVTAKKI
jgi:cyclopropane-fatty-acyl-phospholipid synthase